MAKKKTAAKSTPAEVEQARKDFEQLTQPAPPPTFDNFNMIMEVKRRARQLRDIQAKEKLTKELQRANDLKEREQSATIFQGKAEPGDVDLKGIMFTQNGKEKFIKLLDCLDFITPHGGSYIINAVGPTEAMRYAISIIMCAHNNNWICEFFRKKKNGDKEKKWSYITNNFSYRTPGDDETCSFNSKKLSEAFNENSNSEEDFDCSEMDHVGGFIH